MLRSIPIKLRLCKRVSTFLAKKDLIPTSWLCKPSVEVSVNLTGKGPMLAIHINGVQASAILDTGSTFTLLPFPLWQKLNLNSNLLDQTVIYNTNSASHKNPNAGLGSLNLTLAIQAENGEDQLINHKCLILRPDLKLDIVLLGEDFLCITT